MAIADRTSERARDRSSGLSLLEGPPEPEPSNRSRGAALVRSLLIAVAVVVIAGLVVSTVLVGYLAYLVSHVEVPPAPSLAQSTRLFDRSGEPIATLHGAQDRDVVPLDRMSEHLADAVLAAEDKGFYDHGALDPLAMVRAMITNVAAGEVVEGGSTITQQYVKNVYTGGDRTLARKLREAALAIRLEQQLSKDEILERYLNTIFFGHGAYGAEAAALAYFDRPARRLSVLQAATLAGLIAGPTRFDPIRHPERALMRRNYVLAEMVDSGSLAPRRAATLAERPLRIDPGEPRDAVPFFSDHVRRFLEERYGRRRTLSGGLRVETTIDLGWQRAAETAIGRYLPDPEGPQAALVAIDPRTGEIRAMVGGRSFARAPFNLATQARRQTGSAFKTFVLAAALREGISPSSTRAGPSSLTIADPRCETRGEPWKVSNYADASAGTMSIAQGLASSVNTIYAQLALEVGPEDVAEVAGAMGIGTPLAPVCSIALGTQEVTPLEMTSAYATIAAGGVRREPTPVSVVRDASGGLEDRPVDLEGERVLSRNVAATLTWALEGVVTSGTGTAAALGDRPVAGKTGTSQEYTNAWFCGFVPQLATCVWVGYPSENRPMTGFSGLTGVTGGSIPAAIWHDFMAAATSRMRLLDFREPSLDAYEPPSYRSPLEVGAIWSVPATTEDGDEDGEESGDENDEDGGLGNGHGNGGGNGNGNGNGKG